MHQLRQNESEYINDTQIAHYIKAWRVKCTSGEFVVWYEKDCERGGVVVASQLMLLLLLRLFVVIVC